MSNFFEQLEQMKGLISSTAKSEKSCGYSMLLHLQEESTKDDALSQLLVESSQTLMSSVVKDVQEEDEEISVPSLKCLGFMIYFPPVVAKITGDAAGTVLEMLAGVIMTTKMKSVCNVAVWCLSIQNLDASVLGDHSASLVRAIVHSLDNPTGSLSTTFEGIQAIMKLASQIKKLMKDTSSVWAPPIFRRLVSAEKKERDMCQRCLLKVESVINPPSVSLSKAIFQDMKSKLLPGVKELLKHGKKVQALQAWRWFILLLGSHAVKHRHLINEMLKVPEQTFSDQDPQVQIASLVAWEGLIDVLIGLPLNLSATRSFEEQKDLENASLLKRDAGVVKIDRSLKLIMTPLIGIMSGQCDASVRSSCFTTWCYLLHKLDIYVNESGVLSIVMEPIFEAVFQTGLEDGNICLWKFCINLLEDFIQSKGSNAIYGANDHSSNLSEQKCQDRTLLSDKSPWKQYTVKWLPWNCSQLGFFLRVFRHIIINPARGDTISIKNINLSSDRMLRILCSVLKGAQLDLRRLTSSYDDIMQSLKTIMKFVNCISEAAVLGDNKNFDLLITCLQVMKVIVEELDPSLLGSPLYRLDLDFKYISSLQSDGEVNTKLIGIDYVHRLDMDPPIIYLTITYFSLLIHMMLKTTGIEFIQQELCNYLKDLFSSYNPLEILHTIVGLLYDYCDGSCLKLWIVVAQGLEGFLDSATDLMLLNTHSRDGRSFTISHLFICPLVMSFTSKLSSGSTSKDCNTLKSCDVSSQRHTFEEVKRIWKSLYCSIIACTQQESSAINSFPEDLSLLLGNFLDSNFSTSECAVELTSVGNIQELNLLSLCGEAVICMLDNIQIRKLTLERHDLDCKMTSGIDNFFEFIARVLKLSAIAKTTEPHAISNMISRMFSSLMQCVRRLELRDDIHGFSKVICNALVPWMSHPESNQENLSQNLQLLWTEILVCLQRSKPAIIFDSSCLQIQAAILRIVLDHPMSSIRDPTVSFWNSTYGNQTGVDFPSCLMSVLDKLSREGKIKIRSTAALEKDDPALKAFAAPCKYKVTATLNMNSKRVELLDDTSVGHGCIDKPPAAIKRQRRELTEHQKEVRRAQQGRARDCGGHGPGIRTYTGLDFSQGNEYEDSQDQESQEIRNAELILDLLKRSV